jgi:hypothetical protein
VAVSTGVLSPSGASPTLQAVISDIASDIAVTRKKIAPQLVINCSSLLEGPHKRTIIAGSNQSRTAQ